MLQETVHTRLFSEPQDIQVAQPGVDYQVVALGRGPFAAEVTTMDLGNISLHIGHASPLMGLAKVGADSAVLQLPLKNVETLLLNGVACQPGVVGIYACGGSCCVPTRSPAVFASA